MGLLQKAVETYDAMAHRAGKIDKTEQEPLAPISHILTRAQIEITLDQDGRFLDARTVGKDEEGAKIIIPVTEASAGRAGTTVQAHPLCDELGYVSPYNSKKYARYVETLTDWANSEFSHPKLKAILAYIRNGTILFDLSAKGVIQLKSDGAPSDEKLRVRWVVNGLGEEASGSCWTDKALMDAFVRYQSAKQADASPALCMISGTMEPPAGQHPKGIISLNGNAKLISANDSRGFTYRGRFSSEEQAATVSYTASQKAHNALRWLAANEGVPFGGRTFLCWNPEGNLVPKVNSSMGGGNNRRAATPTQYREQLREALSGWKERLPAKAGVVIAAFDAATTGRLALTYYNELLASDFLQRLHDWEATCCWENVPYGIQSPSLYQIIVWTFGTLQNGKMKPDDRILSGQMQRLIACRVNGSLFPLDIGRALAEKASNLLIYEGENRHKLLFTACAAIRKYRFDHLKEEWDMALDQNSTNRSYLFGRLLAVAEMVEHSAYGKDEGRETNALRLQKAFALRPLSGWRMLEEKLEPYYKRLDPGLRQYYRGLEQEIVGKLSAADGDLNKKLDDVYLLGYYHQRAYHKEKPAEQAAEE